MVDQAREKETVVVEGDRRDRESPSAFVIGLIVILALIILFFLFGGFGMFNGSGSGGDTNINTGGGTPTQAPTP